ncbi:MAG: hypothetical protein ACE5IR_10465 [bacterium]
MTENTVRIDHLLGISVLFVLLDSIVKALQTSPWSEDIYLLSSLFRDLVDEMRIFEKQLNIAIPQPNIYPGEEYFAPFAKSLFDLFKQLENQTRV